MRIHEQTGVDIDGGIGFEEVEKVGDGVCREDVELDSCERSKVSSLLCERRCWGGGSNRGRLTLAVGDYDIDGDVVG